MLTFQVSSYCCLPLHYYYYSAWLKKMHVKQLNKTHNKDVFKTNTHPQSSKHETLSHCCFHVGLASQTLAQHWNSIGSTSRVCWASLGHRIWLNGARDSPNVIHVSSPVQVFMSYTCFTHPAVFRNIRSHTTLSLPLSGWSYPDMLLTSS